MPQASLQLNQLLGDGALLNALRKGGVKNVTGDKATDAQQIAAFQNLLAGLAKARHGDHVSKILTASTTKAAKGADAVDTTSMWGQLQITPELIATLKNLSPEDLKSLPPEVSDFLAPYMNSDGALSNKIIGILDALSAPVNDDGETPELFTVVDDPDLAAFLAGFAAHMNQAAVAAVAEDAGKTAVQPFASFLRTHLSAPIVIDSEKGTLSTEVEVLPGQTQTLTLSIADLDSEGFQALKKLAFADIAPYLTLPRAVAGSGNNVIKVAQGPSFLNEDTSAGAVLMAIALASALPADVVNKLNLNTTPAVPETPIYMNTGTAVQANVAASSSKVPQAFGKTQLMAALMGIPEHETAASKGGDATATTEGKATAKTAEAATDKSASAALAQAVSTAKTNAGAAAQTPAAQMAMAAAKATQTGNAALKGLDHTLMSFDATTDLSDTGLESAFQLRAGHTTPGSSVTTLIAARAAGQPHPSSHLVSVAIQRAAEGAAPGMDKQFVIRMDPPELGRIKVTLEFTENNGVKAKLLAERPETLSLLQKDAVMLERALSNNGIDTGNAELSFDLAQDNAFSGGGGHDGSGGEGGSQGDGDDGTGLADIETVMPIFVDPETGLTHVNIVI